MKGSLEILIPTCSRPAALALTLSGLLGQEYREFGITIADQTEGEDSFGAGEVMTMLRLLRLRSIPVRTLQNLPRRGMAQQRQYLLEQAGQEKSFVLFLDDDLFLEPYVVSLMMKAIEEEGCAFVGCAPIGLSYLEDIRPEEQCIEFWEGPVTPETVKPNGPGWERWRLHNAANILHIQEAFKIRRENPRKYRVAWVGGCVLYDVEKLRSVGAFSFWPQLPRDHAGEEVLVQLRLMSRYGGCGVIPSGVYHMELPTTVRNREVDAPRAIPI